MPLDIQIGSLGAEKFYFEIHKNTHWKKYLFFHEKRLRRVYGNWILDPLSSCEKKHKPSRGKRISSLPTLKQ